MSRANQWFVPGDGIAREVITADIQRYLGPDALVRPGPGNGEYEGRTGYWITAYRTLTSQMISDLKMDSLRWQQEQGRQEGGRRGAYQDSNTHAARQHWGPTGGTESYPSESQRETARPTYPPTSASTQYPGTDSHSAYTTAPTNTQYGGSTYPVASSAAHAAPRTNPSPYGGYPQPARESHPGYAASTPAYSYPTPAPQDYPRQQPPAPPSSYTQASQAAPGYYIASDGRQYPLPQQQPRRR